LRLALAISMTATTSDKGHLDMPPSFTGLGKVPFPTQRQNVGMLHPKEHLIYGFGCAGMAA
jgi:hypothetical protein